MTEIKYFNILLTIQSNKTNISRGFGELVKTCTNKIIQLSGVFSHFHHESIKFNIIRFGLLENFYSIKYLRIRKATFSNKTAIRFKKFNSPQFYCTLRNEIQWIINEHVLSWGYFFHSFSNYVRNRTFFKWNSNKSKLERT